MVCFLRLGIVVLTLSLLLLPTCPAKKTWWGGRLWTRFRSLFTSCIPGGAKKKKKEKTKVPASSSETMDEKQPGHYNEGFSFGTGSAPGVKSEGSVTPVQRSQSSPGNLNSLSVTPVQESGRHDKTNKRGNRTGSPAGVKLQQKPERRFTVTPVSETQVASGRSTENLVTKSTTSQRAVQLGVKSEGSVTPVSGADSSVKPIGRVSVNRVPDEKELLERLKKLDKEMEVKLCLPKADPMYTPPMCKEACPSGLEAYFNSRGRQGTPWMSGKCVGNHDVVPWMDAKCKNSGKSIENSCRGYYLGGVDGIVEDTATLKELQELVEWLDDVQRLQRVRKQNSVRRFL